MFEYLINFDLSTFEWINQGWSNAFLDTVMPLLREKRIWIPLYIFIGSFVLINFRLKGLLLVLFCVLTVAVTDTLSSKVIKRTVQRPRPCQMEALQPQINVLARCAGYSFTSSHATNHFGVAFFLIFTLGRLFKWIRWPLIAWAAAVSVAQVYVGLHFPLDILAGAIVGYFIAKLTAFIFNTSIQSLDNPLVT